MTLMLTHPGRTGTGVAMGDRQSRERRLACFGRDVLP